jgi:hypothetical protein
MTCLLARSTENLCKICCIEVLEDEMKLDERGGSSGLNRDDRVWLDMGAGTDILPGLETGSSFDLDNPSSNCLLACIYIHG